MNAPFLPPEPPPETVRLRIESDGLTCSWRKGLRRAFSGLSRQPPNLPTVLFPCKESATSPVPGIDAIRVAPARDNLDRATVLRLRFDDLARPEAK